MVIIPAGCQEQKLRQSFEYEKVERKLMCPLTFNWDLDILYFRQSTEYSRVFIRDFSVIHEESDNNSYSYTTSTSDRRTVLYIHVL
jgi:hypothetical protein